MKYENNFGISSIFNIFHRDYYRTLYDDEIMEKLWENVRDCEIINIYDRKLPQLDYHCKFIHVADVVFKYKDEYYIIYANIICEPFITGKWYRNIKV